MGNRFGGPAVRSIDHVAVVLGLYDTGVAAARCLGRAGVPVLGFDSRAGMPGFRSRFCVSVVCPDPVHRSDDLLEFLLATGAQLDKPGVLLATSDAFVLFLSRHRSELSELFRFALPSHDVMESILDKRRQYGMVEATGTPIPRTFYPETMAEVEALTDLLDFPAFIKPYYGHLWREKFATKGFKVFSPAELLQRYMQILPSGFGAMIQTIVPGPNTSHVKLCAYIGEQGEPLAVFTLRKIRQWPTEFGVGTVVESVHDHAAMDAGLRLLRAIGYRGVGSIEFKEDAHDGRLKFIELNPRLWLQHGLAADCGVNFPLIQYLDLTGRRQEPMVTYRDGVTWLDAREDLKAFLSYHRRGQLPVGTWLRSVFKARSFSTFALDDLGPFLSANQCGVKYLKAPFHAYRAERTAWEDADLERGARRGGTRSGW